MPGRTLDTLPLYRLPTTPRCRSRSMKISATWSSSRIATRVSWALEEMIISLVMPVILRGQPASRSTDPGQAHHVVVRWRHPEERDHVRYSPCVGRTVWSTRQLVNRRFRTLRIRPNAANVAIMEEPP